MVRPSFKSNLYPLLDMTKKKAKIIKLNSPNKNENFIKHETKKKLEILNQELGQLDQLLTKHYDKKQSPDQEA